MEIRQVMYFVSVVESGSISRAAEALRIAQPALSAQMGNLEQQVGCQLLSRSSRGATPTTAGEEFYRRAKVLLKQVDSLQRIGSELSATPAGHVVVGAPTSAANMIAVPLLHALKARYPDITISLIESPSAYLGDLLLSGRLDVTLLFDENLCKGMSSEPLLVEDLFVVGIPTDADELPLLALDGHRLVMPAQPNSIRRLLDRACADSGVRIETIADVSSPATMLQLAHAGIAATILPWSVIGANGRIEGLPVARLVGPGLARRVSIAVSSESPQSPALLAVRELMKRTVRRLVGDGVWKGADLAAGLTEEEAPRWTQLQTSR
jgi:DNA-binding transcriptional LysR family regulator